MARRLMIFNFPIMQDGAFRKISVAFIEKRRLGARNVMPGVQDAIFLLFNRPNLTRNDLLVRPDRTQLLFVADKDVLGAINFFYGLAHEVAAAQRVHCGAIRHQHVARRLAVALLQNLGAVDRRGILFGARDGARIGVLPCCRLHGPSLLSIRRRRLVLAAIGGCTQNLCVRLRLSRRGGVLKLDLGYALIPGRTAVILSIPPHRLFPRCCAPCAPPYRTGRAHSRQGRWLCCLASRRPDMHQHPPEMNPANTTQSISRR